MRYADEKCKIAATLYEGTMHFDPDKTPQSWSDGLKQVHICSCDQADEALKRIGGKPGQRPLSGCYGNLGDIPAQAGYGEK